MFYEEQETYTVINIANEAAMVVLAGQISIGLAGVILLTQIVTNLIRPW